MRSSFRAAGLIGIIGLVVGTLTYSLVGLANNANFVTHDELLGELGLRCSQPSDHVDGIGSCAPPLRAADFAAQRATLTLTMQPQADGTTTIDYSRARAESGASATTRRSATRRRRPCHNARDTGARVPPYRGDTSSATAA